MVHGTYAVFTVVHAWLHTDTPIIGITIAIITIARTPSLALALCD